MIRRIQISGGMLAGLLLIFTFVSPMLYLPATMVKLAGQGAWIAALLGNLGGSVGALLALLLARRYPGLMPGQIARQAGGRWFGTLLGLLHGLFFVWVYGMVARDMIDFGQVVLLAETPAWVVGLLICGTVLYVVWEGLEPIARISIVWLALILIVLIFMALSLVKEVNRLQAEPILYQGFGNILRAGAYVLPWFAEGFAVGALAPKLRPGDRPFRWFMVGAGGSTLLFAGLVLLITLVFGPNLPARLTYPTYSLVQLIMLGRTIGRVEMLISAVWIATIFVKLSLCLYVTATSWSHSVGNESLFRKMAILSTVLGFLLTRLWSGPLAMIHLGRSRSYVIGTMAFTVGWPALLLLLSLRKRPAAVREASHG